MPSFPHSPSFLRCFKTKEVKKVLKQRSTEILLLTSLSLKQTYHKVQNSEAFRLLKLVGGFQNPASPLLSRQKHSTYTLSYWLLFFGNQEQAGQKYNKWVENLVLIENETGKPQANNAQLSKIQAHEDQKANLPLLSVSYPTLVWVPKNSSP